MFLVTRLITRTMTLCGRPVHVYQQQISQLYFVATLRLYRSQGMAKGQTKSFTVKHSNAVQILRSPPQKAAVGLGYTLCWPMCRCMLC